MMHKMKVNSRKLRLVAVHFSSLALIGWQEKRKKLDETQIATCQESMN